MKKHPRLLLCAALVAAAFPLLFVPRLWVLPFYAAANVYLAFRLRRAFAGRRLVANTLACGVALLALAPVAAILARPLAGPPGAPSWLWLAAAAWLMSLPYWLLAALFWDAVRRLLRRAAITPPRLSGPLAAAASVLLVATLFANGHRAFSNPVTRAVTVRLEKSAGDGRRVLRAAVASDLHLGELAGRDRVRGWVDKLNARGADIILLPGDLIDRDLALVRRQGSGAELARLSAPLGVWAVLGNHETYAGDAACADFLRENGIRVLRDEAVEIAGAFRLAGREDSRPRKPLSEILRNTRARLPLIVLDHRPAPLAELEREGVDLQISGHTHAGQIWPVTWLVRLLNEVAVGHGQRGAARLYVTSGLGLWGLPVRIGSVSELLDLRVEFAPPDGSAGKPCAEGWRFSGN